MAANTNPLFTAKSMQHMNPLEDLDETIRIVRPAPWLFVMVPVCAVLCILAWVFLVRIDVSAFMG